LKKFGLNCLLSDVEPAAYLVIDFRSNEFSQLHIEHR